MVQSNVSLSTVLCAVLVACLGVSSVGAQVPSMDDERPALRFRDVPAAERGLGFVHRSGAAGTQKHWMIECVGTGVGLIDVDDDGDVDVYAVQGGTIDAEGEPVAGDAARDALFLNDGGGRFDEAGEAAGELSTGFGFGVSAADVDGDGDEDLLVLNLGPNDLLLNDGTGRLQPSPGGGGLAGEPTDWSMAAAFSDADRDGDLDAYVTNYLAHDLSHPMLGSRLCKWVGCEVPCGPAGLEAQPDRFLLNDGKGHFTEVTSLTAFGTVEPRYAFQPIFSDLDDDGDPDLFVANDSVPNSFFENTGEVVDGVPVFTERGMRTGLALSGTGKEQAGMGVAVGDLDGDGRQDIVMTNFSREQNAVFLNASRSGTGALFFEESGRSGLGRPSFFDLGWGVNLLDGDLDGDLDVFVANGHVYPQVDDCGISQVSYAQANQIYAQVEPGRFEAVGERSGSGLASVLSSRGSAAGDLDGDGDLDLIVTNLDGPFSLLINESWRAGSWVRLDLRPLVAAVGARVTVAAGDWRSVHELRRGGSFLGVEPRRLHIGLPEGTNPLDVEIRWPDGVVETWRVPRDATTVLARGEGDVL